MSALAIRQLYQLDDTRRRILWKPVIEVLIDSVCSPPNQRCKLTASLAAVGRCNRQLAENWLSTSGVVRFLAPLSLEATVQRPISMTR